MDTSLAETADLTCPQCGKSFTADVWLVVDGSTYLILPIFAPTDSSVFQEVSVGLP